MVRKFPELKIPDGAKPTDHFVVILDPAVGTGTFLVEVIDVVYRTMTEKWQKQGFKPMFDFERLWNEYVPKHLLPRLYGFELMMAPYAICHMKLGLKLFDTGYRFGATERARIYLTNTLEPPRDFSGQFDIMAGPIAHEARQVNEVKRNQRFTVVVGNPPYAGISANMSEQAQRLVDAYRVVDGVPLNETKLWLQDDYVKFVRFSQAALEQANVGVLGFITNHGYLDNPTFRGMRQSLMQTFQRLRVLDLHGNANKKERSPDGTEDKNVFDIRQGVAICLGTRASVANSVHAADLWGVRGVKYDWLAVHDVTSSPWVSLRPDSPYYLFEPQNTNLRADYDRGWKISEAMPFNSAGFITARDHFVVAFDDSRLMDRLLDFANAELSDADIRARYFAGAGAAKYPDGDTRGWKMPAARTRVQADQDWRSRTRTCLYRPFDKRKIYWTEWMVDWPRPQLTKQLEIAGNKALITTRITNDPFGAFVTRHPAGHKSVGAYDVNYVFPLLVEASGGTQAAFAVGRAKLRPNFSQGVLRDLFAALGLPRIGQDGLAEGTTPDDIPGYVYAVLHSPVYRARYAEFLKIDFPRLPLTSSLELFRELARLGGELVALHLVEFTLPAEPDAAAEWPRYPRLARFTGSDRTVAAFPSAEKAWSDGRVAINGSSGFEGVPEDVWNFHIGGYQVCHKWLKDRKGRTLTDEDILHYAKIVTALHETIRLMREIDEVIEAHGGWPAAFQPAPAPEPAE